MPKPDDNNPPAGDETPPAPPPAEGGEGGKPPEGNKPKGDLQKALDAERYNLREEKRKRKEYETELATYKQKEKERDEAALKRKGDYDKLEENNKNEIATLKTENDELKKFQTDYEEKAKTRIDKMKEGLPEESLTLLNLTLEGRTLQEQETLLPQLVEKFKVPSNINNPPQGGISPTPEKQKQIADIETAIIKAKEGKNGKEHLKLTGELQKLQQAS